MWSIFLNHDVDFTVTQATLMMQPGTLGSVIFVSSPSVAQEADCLELGLCWRVLQLVL